MPACARSPWPLLLLAFGACSAGEVMGPGGGGGKQLAWVAPTTNADGTPLHDLAGYKLHYDTTGRGGNAGFHYANVKDIGMPSCSAASGGGTECQYDSSGLGLAAGAPVYLAVTAYDRATPPNESAYSNE